MNEVIKIGRVQVPLEDYAVGASAVLGIRDSGKTVTSKGICEQLIDQGVQPIIFDAVGKWRWLKVAGTAHGKAYKVVVAGGRDPDLPLTPHSVPEIIRAALRERIPLVIDLFSKNMSKADWRRIVQTAIHIIHYENEGGAAHVFLEEAAEFVPQKIYDGETYAEVEKLVRMGGNASVGITLINQRSQEVNKAVLDNCSTALILGCQVGKNAIQAVESWIEKLDSETAEEVTASLPKLKAGEAWVWTRKSLTHPTREQMPMCRSFHPDRRTPEIILKSAKTTDTAEFVAKMAASIPQVIEEAKANDPTELKREIAKLRRELSAKLEATEIKEVPLLTKHQEVLVERIGDTLKTLGEQLEISNGRFVHAQKLHDELKSGLKPVPLPAKQPAKAFHVEPSRIAQKRTASAAPSRNGNLPKCEAAILRVLANFPHGKPKREVGVIAGYKHNGGGFNNALGALRSAGYIHAGEPLRITKEGLEAHGPVYALPSGEELFNYWSTHPDLGRAEREILRVLYEAGGKELTKETIAAQTQSDRGEPYDPNGGGFNNAVGRLRTYELITGRGAIRAAREFFE